MTNVGVIMFCINELSRLLKDWREEEMTARKAAFLLQEFINWKRIRGKYPNADSAEAEFLLANDQVFLEALNKAVEILRNVKE